MTITMDDMAMNGTNRVVLDGVMTGKECDRILQLATVSSDCLKSQALSGGSRNPHTLHFVSDRLQHRLEMATEDDDLHTHLMRHLRA